MATLGGISSIVVGDKSLVGSEVARLRGDLLIDNAGKIQISTNNDPPATSILLGTDDAIAVYGSVASTIIRGGDHTAGGSKGISLVVRPGRGDAVADDGSLTLQDGRAVNHIKIGPTALTMNLGPTTSNYNIILGVDTANSGTVKDTIIRGADNTGTGGKGQNVTIRSGKGNALADNGYVFITSANGTTPAATNTGLYIPNSGAPVYIGCVNWGIVLGSTYCWSYVPWYIKTGDAAIAGDNLVFGANNTTSDVVISTGLIRGADHTYAAGAGSYGVNIAIRPGKGSTAANNGWVHLCNADGTPGTTKTGFMVAAEGTIAYCGGGNIWNFGMTSTATYRYIYERFIQPGNIYLALVGDNILFGSDRNGGAAVAISTGLIRGADHYNFANSKGVNITVRPGRGDVEATDDGIMAFKDARSNDVISIDYLGFSLARMKRLKIKPTTDNPYTVLDTDLVLVVKASGHIDLPVTPTTDRVLYIMSGGLYTPTIDGNGKNINGSATYPMGNYEGVILMVRYIG